MTSPADHIDDEHEAFRAALASVHQDGRRRWITARQPSGRLYRWRTIVAWILVVFFVSAPFVSVGGHQFMLLNLLQRRFVLFGVPFWPQDLWLLVLVFLVCLVTIVLLTATIGRVWCGWMCPQTIFLEMVFRRLEWLIEGSAGVQLARRAAGWTAERIVRAGIKHAVFLILSFGIANVFLAYLISSKTLLRYVHDGPAGHLDILVPLGLFSIVFYAVFARFREQACVIVCPYGRYMSSLVDDRTLAVTYDNVRGEPRGKGKDREGRGDCVDCHQCVTVCPTGIDIRNGLQLECVQCTACIDACNTVMTKVQRPQGLIRYTSADAVRTGVRRWWTPRIAAYAVVWVVLVSVVTTLFLTRAPMDVVLLRMEGTRWITTMHGTANVYRLDITNRRASAGTLQIDVVQPAGGTIVLAGIPSVIDGHSHQAGRCVITLPAEVVRRGVRSVTVNVRVDGIVTSTEQLPFLAPPGGSTP